MNITGYRSVLLLECIVISGRRSCAGLGIDYRLAPAIVKRSLTYSSPQQMLHLSQNVYGGNRTLM